MDRRGAAWWLLGPGAVVGFVLLRTWDPAQAGVQVCIFRGVLDLPCPGCGLTRAAAYLARGSFASAFALHPLAWLFALEAVAGWVSWGFLGGERFHRFVNANAVRLVLVNVVPLFALWLGRAATGSLPF